MVLIFLLLLFIVHTHCNEKHLVIDHTLPNEILNDKQSINYIVDNIEINERYEIRVSYPAIVPTEFLIEITKMDKRFANRKVLSVEQLQFTAESDIYRIRVTAFRNGLPHDMERLKDPILFNIIINRLYFGCSYETWKILSMCVIIIAVIILFLSPFLHKILEKIIDESSEHLE